MKRQKKARSSILVIATILFQISYSFEFNIWLNKDDDKVYLVKNTQPNPLFTIPKDESNSANKYYDFSGNDKSLQINIMSNHLIYLQVERFQENEAITKFDQNFNFSISKMANKTLMPSKIHTFDVMYNCSKKKSWGRIELIFEGKVLISGEKFTFELGYNKICHSHSLKSSDLSYFPLLAFVMLILYKVSTNINQENINNIGGYSAGVNVFHLTLFAGSGLLTCLSAMLAPEGNYNFVKGTFSIAAFSSMSIMFEFIIRRLFEEERLHQIRICGFITALDLSSGLISAYFLADWHVFNIWIGKDVIAFSVVFLILRVIYVKRFMILLGISVLLMILDIYYYSHSMENNGFNKELTLSAKIPLPVKFILPRVMDYPFNDYVSIGIGDVILYGLLFKFLRKFDLRRGPSAKKFSDLAFVAMGVGFFIFIIFASFRKFALPFLVFTEPLMYLSLVMYSCYQKNLKMLYRFGGDGIDDENEMDPLLEGQERDSTRRVGGQNVEMDLLV